MSGLALYLLGSPRTLLNDDEIQIGRRKAVALLAYLAVTNRSHSREALATFLWPEYDQSHALAYLRRVLSELNKSLGESSLEVDRETVSLGPASLWSDVAEFRKHLAVYKFHDHHALEMCEICVPHLEHAVNLYQGDFLEGFTLRDSAAFDEWQFFLAEELRRDLSSSLERLVHWHNNKTNYEVAISYARRWLALDPLHEPAHRCLMLLYAEIGQKAAALRQYQLCAQLLGEELGMAPSEETTSLYKHIRFSTEIKPDQELAPARVDIPLADEHRPLNNLPVLLSSFIGREKEIREVRTMMLRPDVRLLTLTGPGGTGKTRLSLAIAGEVINEFPDGVYFVPLSALRDPAMVLDAVAHTLGLRNAGDMTLLEILKFNLRDKHLLLVLDNFEHVVQAAPEVSALLTSLSQLKVLVTSRALLHVTGEHNYPVLPMHLPDAEVALNAQRLAQNEAVQLFVDRAVAVKPGFTLTDQNAQWMVEICARLDGLPLAIELAAARIRLLPLQELRSQLEHRLNFLKGGAQDLPARQRTLRSTIEWSYDLLGMDEQVLFRRLAVFAGGCTVQAVEAICHTADEAGHQSVPPLDVLSSLEKLVDQSLLQQSESQGTARFTMLDTIQEYALEQLTRSDEAESIRQAHAYFYLELAEESEIQLDGPQPALWLERLDWELDNLRAVLKWALAHDITVGLRLASALARFWILQARLTEGREWLARALAQSDVSKFDLNPLRAWALRAACELAWHQGDSRTGIDLGEESVAIFRSLGDRRGLAYALQTLAQATFSFPDNTKTLKYLEESLALCREINDDLILIKVLYFWGWKLNNLGEYTRASAVAEECYDLADKINAMDSLAAALWLLGRIDCNQTNYSAALKHFEKSLKMYQQIGNKTGERFNLDGIGTTLYLQGDYDQAKKYGQKILAMLLKTGNIVSIAATIGNLGYIALHQDNLEEARSRFIESLYLLREIDIGDYVVAGCLAGLVLVTKIEEQPERIIIMLGAVETLRSKTFIGSSDFKHEIERMSETARQYLGEDTFARAYARGLVMTRQEAIAYALLGEEEL
jgi:predicted ATPase/DNA-binding SARP family transcriptional activator